MIFDLKLKDVLISDCSSNTIQTCNERNNVVLTKPYIPLSIRHFVRFYDLCTFKTYNFITHIKYNCIKYNLYSMVLK